MTTPIGAMAPRIEAPLHCSNPGNHWDDGAYIRVHGDGHRKLVLGRQSLPEQCWKEGPQLETCNLVLVDQFGHEVLKRLRAKYPRGEARFGGISVGVCGEIGADLDYDRAHLSVSVFDWADVDAAIAVVDEVLDAWKIGNHYGVSVRGSSCVEQGTPALRDLAHELVDSKLVQPDG